MINSIKLDNFGPLKSLEWSGLGNLNLVLGGNGTGKTFLLKALYASMRTLEEFRRGDDQRSASEILADKLYWTFQVEKIGDLVAKNSDSTLEAKVCFNNSDFRFEFGRDTRGQIASLENHVKPRSSNSVFLPAKEVLSLHHIILKSREQDKVFGFDDTYLDLARALRLLPERGKNFKEFAASRQSLENMLNGKVEYDESTGRWQYRNNYKQKFNIGVTAEGIKKIAILDTLLGNRYLALDSIIFIDEPESALHPSAISEFMEIVTMLAERGLQFFLASHSYFVVKKLYLLAQKKNLSIPVIQFADEAWQMADLKAGMPDNPIINESIRLYEEEVELVLK